MAMAGHGRPWPAMARHGPLWPAMAGYGLSWPAMAGHDPWPGMASHARFKPPMMRVFVEGYFSLMWWYYRLLPFTMVHYRRKTTGKRTKLVRKSTENL